MPVLISRRRFLALGLVGSSGIAASGCGSVLYPERIGQPAGMLDWKVVALDTLGLLLFFIPGVIAFVVDFYNGTIYLPQGRYGQADQPAGNARLVAIKVPRGQLNRAGIEQIVSKHVARNVRLDDGQCQTRTLRNIDDYWHERDSLLAEHVGSIEP